MGKKVVLTRAKMWERVACVGKILTSVFWFLQAAAGLSSRNTS